MRGAGTSAAIIFLRRVLSATPSLPVCASGNPEKGATYAAQQDSSLGLILGVL